MSFESDIATIMKADASLNSMVDLIFSKRMLPKTDETANSILIYSFNKEESENSRSGMNFLTKWSLQVYVGSRKNSEVISISNRVQEYLENYQDDNVSLVIFDDDKPDYDDEADIHYNDLYFTVLYQ